MKRAMANRKERLSRLTPNEIGNNTQGIRVCFFFHDLPAEVCSGCKSGQEAERKMQDVSGAAFLGRELPEIRFPAIRRNSAKNRGI